MRYIERDFTRLDEYCSLVSHPCGVLVPPNYPAMGEDTLYTATGNHAAAVIKALRKEDSALAYAVYSSIPARLVGRRQEIYVGPMSGRSNAVLWLEHYRLPVSDSLVDKVHDRAKETPHVPSDKEIADIVHEAGV